MNTLSRLFATALGAALCAVLLTQAQPTAFTYQGQLQSAGGPATDAVDLQFQLFDASVAGSKTTDPVLQEDVKVDQGVFAVSLDFGAVFDGTEQWLEIGVRPADSTGSFAILSPRQPIGSVPQALHASHVPAAGITGALPATQLSGQLPEAQLPPNAARLNPPNTNERAQGVATITSGFVTEARVTFGGSGYLTAPTVTLKGAGGAGSGAIITATVASGQVTALTVVNAGSGYTNGADLSIALPPSNAFQTFAGTNYFTSVNAFSHASNSFAGTFTGTHAGNGAALTNLNAWRLDGNAGTTAATHFVGTTDAAPLVLRAGNEKVLQLEGNVAGVRLIAGRTTAIDPSSTNSSVLGGRDNTIGANAHESTIAGGLDNTIGPDQLSAFIGGGARNQVLTDNQHAVIVGGRDNRIGTNCLISLVAGGGENRIANNVDGGLMVGGFRNDILGSDNPNRRLIAPMLIGGSDNEIGRNSSWAAIIGGDNSRIGTNCASAIIVGGTNNLIADNAAFSFAAGRRCRVNHLGAFVFADSQNASFASAGDDTFNVRAQGGIHVSVDTSQFFGSAVRQMINLWGTSYGIGVQSSTHYSRTDASGSFSWFRGGTHTNTANSPGAGGVEMMRLNSGGLRVNGTFVSASDRNLKENFKPLDSREILDKVVALPLSTWNYKSAPDERHVGPMAQDFHAAFALNGSDDRHIATVDTDGVALAAIQGLNRKLETLLAHKDGEIARLQNQNADLLRRLEALEHRLAP